MRLKLALLWTLLILIACSIPGSSLPSISLLEYDKFAHFVLFAGFGWLWLNVYPGRLLVILVMGLLYGAGTEFYQGWLPYERSPDPLDFIANALGLLAALVAFSIWQRRRLQQKK